ncbi:lactate utilization protein [Clostridium oryzae]|uniref:LUD domain-containing protein n=1 Tax=Clostridium oryzae TaxID=1450648 RepID=A0A1V4IRD0_9CLOT|nr:lactate utilization protein [Clostridium oryzae]OPJ62439.1 hypothetical protein CLORY_18080 [Clostridium oryzae]
MDNNIKWLNEKKVERLLTNLQQNNMEGYFVQNQEELLSKINELIKANSTVSVGGSATLSETGVLDLLRNGNYNFLDRYEEGLKPDEIQKIFRDTFYADFYLTSSNAILESGELYNVDGNGNRVAAMLFGPKNVIVVAGINKIVKNLDEAIQRNKNISAPANCKRLNRKTPCTVTGTCMECSSPERICNEYTLIKRQNQKGRIKVIIVNKILGY